MESLQQGQTKICDNCQKRFPQEKIDLHQAYCRRNIKKCNVCLQMYDINDQEAHQKQFHSKKDCRYCGQTFPQKQWDVHQPSCKRRPLKCTFCQNDIAYEEIIRHQEVCGSRTTKCQVCRKFIPLRQFDTHKLSCIQRQSPIRNEQRASSRQDPRQNIREFPAQLQRMRSEQQRRNQGLRVFDNIREYRPYDDGHRRNERGSNQRLHVVSQDKPKHIPERKAPIRVPNNVKPSHIIEPQRIREMVDPVPISIRLAMGLHNNKIPLQNRN